MSDFLDSSVAEREEGLQSERKSVSEEFVLAAEELGRMVMLLLNAGVVPRPRAYICLHKAWTTYDRSGKENFGEKYRDDKWSSMVHH